MHLDLSTPERFAAWLRETPARILETVAGKRQALDGDDDPDVDLVIEVETTRAPAVVLAKVPLPRKPPRRPIRAGSIDDPAVSDLLDEMGGVWKTCGATDTRISPAEFCRLPKAPGRPVAIPPRELWPWMAALVRDVWTPMRERCGPLSVRGYRPPDYNAAVGGSRGSDHQWACAFDLRPSGGQSINLLKREAAKLYLQRGAELKLGFGGYAGNIHLGAGIRQRYWGDAGKWLKHVKAGPNG